MRAINYLRVIGANINKTLFVHHDDAPTVMLKARQLQAEHNAALSPRTDGMKNDDRLARVVSYLPGFGDETVGAMSPLLNAAVEERKAKERAAAEAKRGPSAA